jgi:hypothetical protein
MAHGLNEILQHIPAESGQMAEISAAPLCAAMRRATAYRGPTTRPSAAAAAHLDIQEVMTRVFEACRY